MRCGRVDRLIERYLDGSLSESVTAGVARHVGRCERCAGRLAAARTVDVSLRAPDGAAAPALLSARIMGAIRRDEASRRARAGRARDAAPGYRRLGYSFVAAAALLAASLFVPRLAYPNLVHKELLTASLGAGKPVVVARLVQDAGQGLTTVLSGASGSEVR